MWEQPKPLGHISIVTDYAYCTSFHKRRRCAAKSGTVVPIRHTVFPMKKPSRELTPEELEALKTEMRRSGERMRAQLKMLNDKNLTLPLELPIWVNKSPWPEKK